MVASRVLVHDDVHRVHDPPRELGTIPVAIEQELLEVAPVSISKHLCKWAKTGLIIQLYLLRARRGHLWGWCLVLVEHLEEEEMHLRPPNDGSY